MKQKRFVLEKPSCGAYVGKWYDSIDGVASYGVRKSSIYVHNGYGYVHSYEQSMYEAYTLEKDAREALLRFMERDGIVIVSSLEQAERLKLLL